MESLSMSSRMGNTAVIYESEASRLQREADNFTKKFEHEKKYRLNSIFFLKSHFNIGD